MQLTEIFIRKPVLATVVSLLILVLGLRSIAELTVRQYPFTQNAIVTITTAYVGADPDIIAGFITTPLENAIAQANGIDYLTSNSTQGLSVIQAYLRLNYDPNTALNEINTKVNAVLNELPTDAEKPTITVSIGESLDSMYIGFYSNVLKGNQITDYLVRMVQPRLQSLEGVQEAEILGGKPFALRAWLDPDKMAAYDITAKEVGQALAQNDFIAAVGRTDGNMITVPLSIDTGLESTEEFEDLIIKSKGAALVRLKDVAKVTLGSENYDTIVSFDGKEAVYIGIKVAPTANLLTVTEKVRNIFPFIQEQLPQGLVGSIVYDATKYVHSSIHEVERSLIEALVIVTIVIFLFLGSIRSVLIPVVAIPLSLIGAVFIMLLLGFSINLLTLLAMVLAIGLVVDDAIIVVENIHRHMEEGIPALQAAILGAKELANPIIAISVVLIAVYVPIGFMKGLTGALFTEFAFTLAGAVGVSAVVALTLSPMMCSRLLVISTHEHSKWMLWIDHKFDQLTHSYQKWLGHSLNYLPVTIVFSVIVLMSIGILYLSSRTELAPQEDQGVIITLLTSATNATLEQTSLYSREAFRYFSQFPEYDHSFQLDGVNGLNSSISGMVLKPWDERARTSNMLQPEVQQMLSKLSGVNAVAFQPPSLPGASGLPVQFVITANDSFDRMDEITQSFLDRARATGQFMFIDSDLKIDKKQVKIVLDREKAADLGLTMQDVGSILGTQISENYINFFNLGGRAYKVIPQVTRQNRLNPEQVLDYYIRNKNGTTLSVATIADLETTVIPTSLNHFQQQNAVTISGVPFIGVSLGQALSTLSGIAQDLLPSHYTIDAAGQSRQFLHESSGLIVTFFFALLIIFLTLAALFESFRDPLIVLISVPMSIWGALIFINLGIGGASLNIYTEVGLVTLIGLISKHGILIVQFANDLQKEGKNKREAIEMAASIRLRPILMTTAAMVLGVLPLIMATGAGAVSRYNIGLVIASGISIGTLFTLFVVPAMYLLLAHRFEKEPIFA